ncbi:helix-turn-helix domain-containing protein [Nocardia sp. NPDC003482]
MRRRLSPQTQAQIVEAYEAGTPTTELARQFGVAKSGILKLLKDNGVEMRRQPMTMEEVDLAVKLYQEEKLSLLAVGQKLGKPKGTIRDVLLGRGVRLRDAHGRER